MDRREREQSVLELLKDLRGLEPLKKLFWSELNYDRVNQPLSRRDWNQTAANALTEDPVLFAGGGQNNDFHVVYSRLPQEQLLLGQERPVVNQLLKEHSYGLFIFSNRAQDHWHFINVKYDEEVKKRRLFRRISISPEERLRTASERIVMLDLQSIQPDMFGLQPLTIQSKHDEAFDVDKVTDEFFKDYEAQFKQLEKDLLGQFPDHTWAHDYSLQFLNRCMFIYFIQRKGWLGNNRDFLSSLWKSYQRSGGSQNSFVDNWLNVLFFEAFNNKFHGGHKYFPPEIKEALSLAPYLNGGLFIENKSDTEHKAGITDQRFEQILKFLERYNFTIAEDSPLDKEVAVDPEMIGKVYESLVNVSEEVDERGEAGIFYTPRTEIDLMCRLSLVDHLANHFGEDRKELLYQLVFALEPDEKTDADKAIAGAGLWAALNERLHDVTLLDPACGSGSFLVGMLNILDDLQERANRQFRVAEAPYERKKRIIGQSLYGVDVMEWACHIAELRLWLALIIDAEIPQAELHVRKEPLLPHFTFKIRQGDSLVQEIGGVNFGHKRETLGLSRELKKRIDAMKDEKLKFYNNDKTCQFHSLEEVKQEERNIFQGLLEQRIHTLENEIKTLNQRIATPQTQMGMIGLPQKPLQAPLDVQNWKRESEQKQTELISVRQALDALRNSPQIPFVWDIAFVEIFESEKDGFDIVIGNPPYVRQEAIADPRTPRDKVTSENKRAYKDKLARSVYQAFPSFFGYKASSNTVAHKIDAKSDLYIYFYLHGLSLLNDKGSFCFITSNSWLDVGYGADLQEFLLKHSHVKLVLDNQVRRTFANADVNSIIALFSPPDDRREWALEKTARFVMFRVPFEHILDPVIFDEIEEATERKATKEYRVFPISQSKLLEDGCKIPEEEESGKAAGPLIKVARYIGNKWGGKYLRAPDIYWTILEKGANCSRSLSDLFDGERYLNTGGADGFFIIKNAVKSSSGCLRVYNDNVTLENNTPFTGEIEQEYLVPLLKDYTKTDKRIEISGHDAYCLVIQEEPSKKVKEYIKWGEKQGYNKRSVTKTQHPWYRPTRQMLSSAKILVPRSFSDSYAMYYNPRNYLSLRFYRLHPKLDEVALVAYLNTTLVALIIETLGNRSLGLGVLDFFMADFLSLRIPVILNKDLKAAFNKLKNSPVLPVKEEYGFRVDEVTGQTNFQPRLERTQLDDVVFDTLSLTRGERDAVYEAVINLVETRLSKADSI